MSFRLYLFELSVFFGGEGQSINVIVYLIMVIIIFHPVFYVFWIVCGDRFECGGMRHVVCLSI